MSRGTWAVLLGIVPLIRAVSDALDATNELGRLVRPAHGRTEVGAWHLEAFLGWTIGLGFVVDHQPAGHRVTEPERTEGIVYLGPLAVAATRERLPEVAPLVGSGAAA